MIPTNPSKKWFDSLSLPPSSLFLYIYIYVKKTLGVRSTFEGSDVVLRGGRKGFCTLPKVSKTWGSCSISKNDGRRGAFEEDLERCMSRGGRSTQDMFIRNVRRSGRWFPETGRSSGLLRWFCVTGAALRMAWHQFFVAGAFFRDMDWKNRKTHWHEVVSSALNFPFLKEASQNSIVFDVAKFKLKKSRRIASFWMLSNSKNEEVSQTCFVFDVVNVEKWGSLAEELGFQAGR